MSDVRDTTDGSRSPANGCKPGLAKARGGQLGPRNHNWKGGRVVASNGYVLVRVGKGHPLADVRGYAYEHRLVAEEKIGRPLRDGEQVHHVDGDKTNNDPRNLDVVTLAEHRVEHRRSGRALRMPGEANPTVTCACGCGQTFERFDRFGRPRRYQSGHNTTAHGRGRAA